MNLMGKSGKRGDKNLNIILFKLKQKWENENMFQKSMYARSVDVEVSVLTKRGSSHVYVC